MCAHCRCLALIVALTTGMAFANEPSSQRWALLIGVDEYQHLQPLKYCSRDMLALRDQLIASGFRAEHVFLLHDAAKEKQYLPFRTNIQRQMDLTCC